MLTVSPEKVCYLVVKAREFDVKDAVVGDDLGSNAADEGFREILSDYPDDPIAEEVKSFIDGMNEDEQAELVALVWLGRGDYDTDSWQAAVAQAMERHTGETSSYLMGIPLLPDLLEEGLGAMGISCDEFEIGRM